MQKYSFFYLDSLAHARPTLSRVSRRSTRINHPFIVSTSITVPHPQGFHPCATDMRPLTGSGKPEPKPFYRALAPIGAWKKRNRFVLPSFGPDGAWGKRKSCRFPGVYPCREDCSSLGLQGLVVDDASKRRETATLWSVTPYNRKSHPVRCAGLLILNTFNFSI